VAPPVGVILILATGTDAANAIQPCGHDVLPDMKENEKEISVACLNIFV
jgi:hypothetical protein